MNRMLAALVTLLPVASASADDWPQWRGPNRDGVSQESVEPWKGELKALWRQPVGEGHSSPVVAGGRVFLHFKHTDKEAEIVAARDAKTGKELWHKTYDRDPYINPYGNGPRATPLVDGDRLYTVGVTGVLTCWDTATGKQHWQLNILSEFKAKNLFFGVSASPIIEADKLLVMVGGPEASIVALDKLTGKTIWKSGSDPASYASPIVTTGPGGKRLAIFLTQQGVVGLNPATGEQHWKFPLVDKLNESSTTPVRLDDHLFASSVTFGSVGLKLTATEGQPAAEQVWKNEQMTCYFSTPIAVAGQLYVVSGKLIPTAAQLQCVDLKTGKASWTRRNVGKYHATVMKVKDRILMLEEPGDLVLIEPNAKEYKELARAKVCGETWAHPALSDGKLFIRDDKELICLELK